MIGTPFLATPVSVALGGTGGTTIETAQQGLGIYRFNGGGQTLTNDTFTDITGMTTVNIPVGTYEARVSFYVNLGDDGFKWRFTGTATPTANLRALASGVTATQLTDLFAGDSMDPGAGANFTGSYVGEIVITVTGTLKLQAAKATTGGTNTSLSFLNAILIRVA